MSVFVARRIVSRLVLRGIGSGVLLFICMIAYSQERHGIYGLVRDAESKEGLPGASVILKASGKGTITHANGIFRLENLQGTQELRISFLGYADLDTLINTAEVDSLTLFLKRKAIAYEEVTISSNAGDDMVSSVRMGDVRLGKREINSLPKLLGEADPIRYLQLTPGVQSSTEGGIGFFVRGGNVDQNLVLFDGATMYNPGHLLGFVSVFNPDIISEVSLLKAGIPARFGGRLSSVIRVSPDRGRSDSLRVRGQIGMIGGRLTVNRSFNRDRGSFILSGRYSSIDMLVKPIIKSFLSESNPFLDESSYYFYDFHAGLNYRIGEKDYLNVIAYQGNDNYAIERSSRIAETKMNWGNQVLSARWTHSFDKSGILRTSISRTDYHFDLGGAMAEFAFNMYSRVKDYSLDSRYEIDRQKHKMAFGYKITRHEFTPNDIAAETGDLLVNFLDYSKLYAFEGGVFAEDEFNLTDKVGISAGIRYSFFNQVGPYTSYNYNEASQVVDSVTYKKGESLAFYHHLEPRLSMRYQLDNRSSIKASYMHMAQYLHLATSATVSLPTDIWLPSSNEIKPQYGDQFSAGYFRQWKDGLYEASAELYYKRSRRQVEFIRGVISSSLNITLQDNIAIGNGRAYGTELFLRKKRGKLTGWAGYTLARSVREFDRINDGRVYPAKFDRRHDLSLACIYQLNKRWNLSAVFVYVSGNAFSMPVGRYIIQGNLVNQYGEVNNYRMPAYHRLDISASRSVKTKNGHSSSWELSIYNAYNRANPFYIYFETTGDLDNYRLDVTPVEISLFPVVPSISYKFEF